MQYCMMAPTANRDCKVANLLSGALLAMRSGRSDAEKNNWPKQSLSGRQPGKTVKQGNSSGGTQYNIKEHSSLTSAAVVSLWHTRAMETTSGGPHRKSMKVRMKMMTMLIEERLCLEACGSNQ